MKKYIKISLIVLLVMISIIVLDTVIARVLKRSPIISWKDFVSDSDSYVDKGILIDTYYCNIMSHLIIYSRALKIALHCGELIFLSKNRN